MKVFIALAVAGIGLASLVFKPAFSGPEAVTVAPKEEGPVKWYTLEEAQELNKKKPRKIFIDVYTDWCGWCKVMDRKTFSQPVVAKYLNEHFYPVKLNAEQTENIIFRGKVYAFNAQGRAHNVAIELLNGQLSYPTTVYLDEKLNLIQPIPGFMEAKQFEPVLHFFAENAYKKQDFEAFQKGFKSEL